MATTYPHCRYSTGRYGTFKYGETPRPTPVHPHNGDHYRPTEPPKPKELRGQRYRRAGGRQK